MGNYHYIVSSLEEFNIEGDSATFDIAQLCETMGELLSKRDMDRLRELWWFYDLRNILDLRRGKGGMFSPLSNLTKEQVEFLNEYYSGVEFDEFTMESKPSLPSNIESILANYRDNSGENQQSETLDKAIWSAYYSGTSKSKSRFIRKWAEFDLNIRNISAAYTARDMSIAIDSVLIGDNKVVEQILLNETVQDFDLKNEFEQIEELIQILSNKDMLLKERELDKLRLKVVEQLIEFDYFNLDAILGYMVKVSLLARWSALSQSEGAEVLAKLTGDLTSRKIIDKAMLD